MSLRNGGKLILVRHGESVGNRDRRFTTSPAAALTELGRQQARQAASRIARRFKPVLVITSPYARARETAAIIAGELGLPVSIEQQLYEQSFGQLAGHTYEVLLADPTFDPTRPWLYRPPGGETREEVRARTVPVLDRLIAEYDGHELVIVSHGGVMSAVWAHVTGRWEEAFVPPNAGIVLIEHADRAYGAPQSIAD